MLLPYYILFLRIISLSLVGFVVSYIDHSGGG